MRGLEGRSTFAAGRDGYRPAAGPAPAAVNLLVALLALLLVTAVIVAVSRPLLAARAPERDAARRRQELEGQRDVKYAEIRDAELDYRTGKLSSEDYELLAAELRAEALEILDRLQQLAGGGDQGEPHGES